MHRIVTYKTLNLLKYSCLVSVKRANILSVVLLKLCELLRSNIAEIDILIIELSSHAINSKSYRGNNLEESLSVYFCAAVYISTGK